MDALGRALGELLSGAQGRSFCDGCLAVELHASRSDVQVRLGGPAMAVDRGHGRCCVCGQTLTVTRVATE